MRNKKSKVISFLFLSLFLLPIISFSQEKTGIVPCNGSTEPCNFEQLGRLVNNIINWILVMATTFASISFAYAGAMMALHPDNPGEKESAKEIFKKTLIGLVIILAAWIIVTTIVKTVTNDSTSILRFFNTK